MNLIEFKDYPSTETPLNAENLNQMQDNMETSLKNKVGVRKLSIGAGATKTITGWLRATYLISTTSNSGVIKGCWLLLTGSGVGTLVNLVDGTGSNISISSNGSEITITNNGSYATYCYITTLADDSADIIME